MYEHRTARIDRFAGLSDRSHPVALTRIENPKLLNVDFSERVARRRYGITSLHTERMKDGSIRLDGLNDYLEVRNQTTYQPSGANSFYVGIGVVLRSKPDAASPWTIVQRGHTGGGGANLHWDIQYDSSTATNATGAWIFRMYDATTPALLTLEIADGDGGTTPIDQYRFVEMWWEGVGIGTFKAKVYKEDDTVLSGTHAATVLGQNTTTENIVIGVAHTAAATNGTTFANITVCEFRYSVTTNGTVTQRLGSDTTYGNIRYRRELVPDEYSLFTGYWKLNDGRPDGILTDYASAPNHATIPENPASWVQTSGEVLGQAGLRFFGHNGFCEFYNSAATGSSANVLTNPFDTTAAGTVQRWTVRGICVPKLATGETTVRDSTIFWAGTHATIPGPLALYISGNTWVASYRDNGTTRTAVISGASVTPTALVGKRVRWAISRYGAAPGTLRLALTYIDGSGAQQFAFTDTALVSGAAPDTIFGFWFIGRHVTSLVLPYTFGTANTFDKGFFGVIDDFQVIWTNSATATPVSHGQAQAFQEKASWGAPHIVVAHLKLNEGGGQFTLVTAEVAQSMTAFLYPAPNEGARWDVGLVRPYRSPVCGGFFDFNRFLPDGTTKRTKLVNSGCTWYEFDPTAATLTAIGATPRANTRWTKDQYAQTALLASDNGMRPVKYDGHGFDLLGIEAPLGAPVLTDAAGGTFTGTYYFYVTFYNNHRAIESNPGPGVAYTYTTRQITQVIIPTSPDPQVTGRRLYMTLGSGADGSLAFLLKEFDDNTQVTWGAATTPFTLTAIAAPVNSGTELEYYDREEAPIGSIVKVFGDNLFVAGNPVFPTRVYRSDVGTPDYFNQDEKNVDLDLDSGDPITGMKPLVDSIFVGLRDGWGRVWNTGDSNNPIGRAILSRDHGPAGPHAMIAVDRIVYYVSERDIFRTDGLTEENISSPARPDYPSIQDFLKSGLNASRRASIVMAQYKSRKQLWIAYAASTSAWAAHVAGNTRNNKVLIYDLTQGVWSDYEMSLDFVAELEDDVDEPYLYGASEGYFCKLDQSNVGDFITPQRITVTAYTEYNVATNVMPKVTYSGAAISNVHGVIAHIYKKSTNEVLSALCEYSETNLLRFYGVTLGLAAGDIVIVGGIRFQMDWVLTFGDSIMQKRLRTLKIAGKSNDAATRLRLQYIKHQSERNPTLTIADTQVKTWPTGTDMLRFEIGGLFRSLRLRLTESDDASGIFSSDPWVSTVTTPPVIYELAAEAEVLNIE